MPAWAHISAPFLHAGCGKQWAYVNCKDYLKVYISPFMSELSYAYLTVI